MKNQMNTRDLINRSLRTLEHSRLIARGRVLENWARSAEAETDGNSAMATYFAGAADAYEQMALRLKATEGGNAKPVRTDLLISWEVTSSDGTTSTDYWRHISANGYTEAVDEALAAMEARGLQPPSGWSITNLSAVPLLELDD